MVAQTEADSLPHDSESRGLEGLQQHTYPTSQSYSDPVQPLDVIYEPTRTHAPIHSLPTELLLCIIDCAAKTEPALWRVDGSSEPAHGPVNQRALGYLRIGHVCHLWRQLCLEASCTITLEAAHSAPTLISGFSVDTLNGVRPWSTRVPPTTTLAGLRVLRISSVNGLDMVKTVTLISLAPSLEILNLFSCTWNIYKADTAKPAVTLLNLRYLYIVACYCQNEPRIDIAEWFIDHLQLPRSAGVQVGTYRSRSDVTAGGQYLARRYIMLAQRLWLSDQPLSLGIGPSSFTLGRFDDTVTDISTCSRLPLNELVDQQVMFDMLYEPLISAALADPEVIQHITSRVYLLSMFQDKETRLKTDHVVSINYSLHHIRILHIRSPQCYERSKSLGIFHRLADTLGDTILFPYIQQLWISPKRSRSTLDLASIAKLLRARTSHPDNQLRVVRLDLPRPAAGTKDGGHAAVIEQIMPVVIWRLVCDTPAT
ncbi:hypothetical protein PENSPDRAFT_657224 [Peniophora sp. CONT]|nr:hypothetical protein PENSPDRAFT_657224 [Peniophora sp. CONT]